MEVIGILAKVIFAIVAGLFAWILRHLNKRLESSLWFNQKVIERRLQVYDEVMPKLNDLFCYYTYVGNWKELTPPQILAWKRELDKKMHISRPLFSNNFFQSYLDFMGLCFKIFNGIGEDAKLRTKIEARRQAGKENWLPEYDRMFATPEECPKKEEVQQAYHNLGSRFSEELGLEKSKSKK